ncbi:hypothetical protein ASPZODRAFT_26451 [Penicilliopsis zonata CBS 506.65]|uniref:Putative ER transporter 6TM N-terminal domain-containing protein n=1 Tax=Penicilliopsis zonata CBS 506.65 TaxID=1073090 RepID=A0A1L9SFB5_9EURO|nr:hypothetical protein ASPZODRAFT_26451 [Penicilliopsis zonata CBS 506.65]OJJ45842.1 hypothetical protein ASPZODRAFT_26451 [Penicilliopsis zonata CBS 506.65]
MTVLILINLTLRVLGSAAFYRPFLRPPPAGSLFVQVIAALSVLVGLSLGWAWGLVAMKAALATRPSANLDARYVLLYENAKAQNVTDLDEYVEIQIFNGFMLDTRVTVTYFCMVGVFIYLVARLRIAVPKLTPVQMFACIVSIVFVADAPLIPTFDGTLAKSLIVPYAIATGVGVVCSIVVFPVSSSTLLLDGIKALLGSMPVFLDACLFALRHPGRTMKTDGLMSTRLKIVTAYKALVRMWWQLFVPPALMMVGDHDGRDDVPGVGYAVFWRRLVLVIVGFSAAVFVHFLPRPPSANTQYRHILADSLASVRDRVALLASSHAAAADERRRLPPADLRQVAEQEALLTGDALPSILEPIKLTRLEFSADTLDAVCHLCMLLNHHVSQLLLFAASFPVEERARIFPAQVLKSSDPLPALLPTPLLSRSIAFARMALSNSQQGLLHRENQGSDRLRHYVVVLDAWVQVLGGTDELVLALKRAIGEAAHVI